MLILVIVLVVALIICASKWLKWYVAFAATIWIMVEKGFPVPTDDETREAVHKVFYQKGQDFIRR